MASPNSSVIVVGAGVFGLSTALHLARGGYRNITVFDRCQFDKSHYNPANGCDGASADINKIFRTAYGNKTVYQSLALEAKDIWLSWNKAIKESRSDDLPEPLTPEDKLLDLCGVYYIGDGPKMQDHYEESLQSAKDNHPEAYRHCIIKNDPQEEQRAAQVDSKWAEKLHMLDDLNGGNTHGFLDISSGITLADKACTYAHFLCKQAGVKFVLGEPQGKVDSLILDQAGPRRRVTGVKTCDGQTHHADLVIVAGGPWSATIVPEAHRSVEATTGCVMFIDVPEHRTDLREKFHPDNFPVWHYRRGEFGTDNYYEGGGFPITREGRLKFGFRGRKLVNFETHPKQPQLRLSTPWTKYSQDPCQTVPLYNLRLMKEVIGQTFPELAELGFNDSRLCWYTDSIDNNFVVDFVPGYSDSLFICTAGSGHAFKFLPVLGKYIKHQLERTPDQFTSMWRWRTVEEGKSANGLELGEERDIKRHQLAEAQDFKFTQEGGNGENWQSARL